MSQFKYHEHLEELGLCKCLIPLIHFEVKKGNKVCSYDKNGNWPNKGSHLIGLSSTIHLNDPEIPFHENVITQINRDMHCNWGTDAYCKEHLHLIIAG